MLDNNGNQEFLKKESEGVSKRKENGVCLICGKKLWSKYEDNICLYCLLDEDDWMENR